MITGIVLASGFSSRMGENKLLLKLNDKYIVEHVILAAVESKLDRVIVVTQYDEIKAVAQAYGATAIYNERASEGMSQSMVMGVQAANDARGYMMILGDQPLLTSHHLDKMIHIFVENPNAILMPNYKGQKGNPVIFPCSLRDELLQVTGDVGGRHVVKKHCNLVLCIDFADAAVVDDIDTKEAYEALVDTRVK